MGRNVFGYDAAYYQTNRERITKSRAEFRKLNKQRLANKNAKYQMENRPRIAARRVHTDGAYRKTPAGKLCCKKKLCKQKGIPFGLTIDFFENVPDSCPQCGKAFGSTRNNVPSLDRLEPAMGYVPGNVEWICMECNRKKDNMSYAEMLEFAKRGLERQP